ncbi:thermonuclease family protein [Candidatus Woesearchaeota archaeon]|nr:thermonuclease family protein [Candidatus Woesearchaeota archaeon]
MKILNAAAAITIITIFILVAAVVVASPEKTDKFGCHKCMKDCEKYSLVKNEYHCHGSVSVQSQNIQIAPRIYGNTTYRRVARIIDGDTLTAYFNGNQQVIRLLGINAPETSPKEKAECYSSQATEQLKKLVATKFVLLEKDKLQNPNRAGTIGPSRSSDLGDDKDKYGRLLRYVTVIGTNVSVNEELVNGGFAKAYPSLTTKVEEYKKLENAAKEKKLGMWGECFKEKKNETLTRLFPLKGKRIDKYGEHQG